MSMKMSIVFVVAFAFLFAMATQTGEARSAKAKRVATGLWGGEHLSLTVTRGGARIEYDCGNGTIDEPLVLDRAGNFSVKGTHIRKHGGPVRRDEQADKHPAHYTGKVSGRTMTITVTMTDTQETLGTFTLRQGQEAMLQRCY